MNVMLGFSMLTLGWASGPAESREEVERRLQRLFEDTASKLEKQDTGAGTRDLQRRIVDELAKLIDPPSGKPNPPPAGTSADKAKPPMLPATRDEKSAKPQRPPAVKQSAPLTPTPTAKAKGEAESVTAKRESDAPTKLADGEWGKFSPRLQPAIDAYARDRFMPRYEELLRQYFRGIAEQKLGDSRD